MQDQTGECRGQQEAQSRPVDHRPPNPDQKPRRKWNWFVAFSLLAVFALSGCAMFHPLEDPTRFYVLSAPDNVPPVTGADANAKRWKIALRPVEVPSFLATKTIAVRVDRNEITYAEFSRWAESLDQGVARLVKDVLDKAPNIESVALDTRDGSGMDYIITLRIEACEGLREKGGGGGFRFKVAWEIRVGRSLTILKRGIFEATPGQWNGSDYGELARRLGEAAGQLGQALAAELPNEPSR